MKKLLYLAIPALLMTACGEKKYSIEGKTTGEYEGKLALLQIFFALHFVSRLLF